MLRTTACLLAVALASSMVPSVSTADGAYPEPPRKAFTPDDSLAVSALFDSGGGTLTATAADGTQFVLTIPPDATALPLQITLTPVSDSGPFPFRGGHAAVKIEPEGAFLWQPAALKILPPSPPDLKSLIYFRDGGPDGRFTLYPGVLGSTEIEMPISYLATYGVRAGRIRTLTSERPDRRVASGPLPIRTLRAASLSLAPYVARQAALFKQTLDGDLDTETYLDEVYGLWDEAWTSVVFPTLDSLGGGCDPDNLTSVFQLVFEFLHLDPQSDPRHGLYGEIIFAVVKEKVLSCIEAHYQLCKSRNDPTQVQLMLNLRMQLQLAQLLSDEEDAAIEDKIIKCLHFEIDFESALTVGLSMAGASFTYRLKVRAIVPVQVEYVQVGSNQRPLLRGSGTISYEFIDIQGPPCTFSVVTQPRTFTVDLLSIMRFKTDQTGEMAAVPRDEIQITMVFFTGEPQESFTMICPDEPGVTATSPFDSVFSAFYGILHQDEALPLGGYQIREQPPWEPIRSGNIFAKAQYVRTVSLPLFGPVPEETYIFLKHTPQ